LTCTVLLDASRFSIYRAQWDELRRDFSDTKFPHYHEFKADGGHFNKTFCNKSLYLMLLLKKDSSLLELCNFCDLGCMACQVGD